MKYASLCRTFRFQRNTPPTAVGLRAALTAAGGLMHITYLCFGQQKVTLIYWLETRSLEVTSS